jgi:hypothetical protein
MSLRKQPWRSANHVGMARGNYANGAVPTVEGNSSNQIVTRMRTTSGVSLGRKSLVAGVRIHEDANCRGASVVVPRTGDANRPNFAAFGNHDGSVRQADDSRSSLAIERGTCVRRFDRRNVTGLASTNICAGPRTVFWTLDRFDDEAPSMRVCATARPGDCAAPRCRHRRRHPGASIRIRAASAAPP